MTKRLQERFRLETVNSDNTDNIDRKFSRANYYMSNEQSGMNVAVDTLSEYGYIRLYIATKDEFNDPAMEGEIRKLIQSYRSMIQIAVKYADYPRMAGSKRFAYQTVISLEDDGNYWMLFRRLTNMGNNNGNGKH